MPAISAAVVALFTITATVIRQLNEQVEGKYLSICCSNEFERLFFDYKHFIFLFDFDICS